MSTRWGGGSTVWYRHCSGWSVAVDMGTRRSGEEGGTLCGAAPSGAAITAVFQSVGPGFRTR